MRSPTYCVPTKIEKKLFLNLEQLTQMNEQIFSLLYMPVRYSFAVHIFIFAQVRAIKCEVLVREMYRLKYNKYINEKFYSKIVAHT